MVKIVLSCDGGGGVRTTITAYMLALLEKDLGSPLYEKFDLFTGSGLGAIIALSLASKKSAQQTYDLLFSQANFTKIVTQSGWEIFNGFTGNKPRYDGVSKKELFMNHFKSSAKIQSSTKDVLVPLYDIERRTPVLFGSDKSRHSLNPKIFELADASSATPLYFPPVQMETEKGTSSLMDISVTESNPCLLAMEEAKKLYGDEEEIILISLGTGKLSRKIPGSEVKNFGGNEWLQHDLLGIAMDSSLTERAVKLALKPSCYLRINPTLPQDGWLDGFDNISPQNLAALKEVACQWYSEFGDNLLEMVDAKNIAKKKKAAEKAKAEKAKAAAKKDKKSKKEAEEEEEEEEEEKPKESKKKKNSKKSKAKKEEEEEEEEEEVKKPVKAAKKTEDEEEDDEEDDEDDDEDDEDDEEDDEEGEGKEGCVLQ